MNNAQNTVVVPLAPLNPDITVHLTASQMACWRPCDSSAERYRLSFVEGAAFGVPKGKTVAIVSPLGDLLFAFTAGVVL